MSTEISLSPLRDWQARWAVPPRKPDKEKRGGDKERGRRDSIQIPGYTDTTAAAGPVWGIGLMGLKLTERLNKITKYAQLFSETLTE